MKKLKVIKEHEDIRPNRSKILRVDTEFTCEDDLANEWLKTKKVKEIPPDVVVIKEAKTVQEAIDIQDELENK